MKVASTIPDIDDYVQSSKLADPKTEQRIIAALMGNFTIAYKQLDNALSPDDFSSEQWRYMFAAIKVLASAGVTVDTTSVEHALRRSGKLEAVGGDTVVATVGLQYDEDITHHRDIVVALSIRRQAISQFKDYIERAEKETVDITTLLEEAAKDMVHFAENATPRSHENKMQELASELFVTEAPEVVPPLVNIDQTPIIKRGDHTLITGKKKSRKSLLITHLITEYIKNTNGNGARVVVFDTEQDRSDVWRGKQRIRKATGADVDFANMRGMSPKQRRDFISWVVRQRPVDLIFIDGIRDCMTNFIDIEETTDLIVWLEDMTVRNKIAVVNVLHQNKNDKNARGHLGTELTNKAIATIDLTLDDKTGFSVVSCESSRHAPFEPFCFTHAIDGGFQHMGSPQAPQTGNVSQMPAKDKHERVAAAFDERVLKYAELKTAIANEFGVGIRKAEVMISAFVREGVILKSGRQGDPNTSYKMSGAAAAMGQEPEERHEPTLFDPILPENGHQITSDGHQSTEDLPF